jgi:hypothetical protein
MQIWTLSHPEIHEWNEDDNDIRPHVLPNFSSQWAKRFLKVHNLSLRKPHSKRRSDPDDANVARYVHDVQVAMAECGRDHVVNMDETCWRICNGNLSTIARRGAESVDCEFDFCQKTNITAIGGISAAGEKLPLWLIKKGESDQCERKLRTDSNLKGEIDSGRLVVTHSSSGWMDRSIAIEYISWLTISNKGEEGADNPVLGSVLWTYGRSRGSHGRGKWSKVNLYSSRSNGLLAAFGPENIWKFEIEGKGVL